MSAPRTILTGAAGGIGAAIAADLAGRGHRLGLLDLHAEPLDALIRTLEGQGHVAAVADVTDDGGMTEAIDGLARQLGGLDHLVANAGVMSRVPLEELDAAHLNEVFDLNVTGAFRAVAAGRGWLREGHDPSVVLLSSAAGLSARSVTGPAYRLSKASLIAMARILAVELLSEGIRVNAIAPGGVEGGMSVAFDEQELTPMATGALEGRLASPSEIAANVAHLLGGDARYITGEVLRIAGGMGL